MTKTLVIDRLVAGYKKRVVLPDFSAAGIRSGEIVALAGPNGAGKSTLLRAIAGLIRAEGKVLLDGKNLLEQSLRERSKSIVFMPQSLPQATNLLAIETVLSALNVSPLRISGSVNDSRHERAIAALARVGASEQALEPIDRLSGGQRQLVAIAQAIVRDPSLVLLDEPTSALDLRNQLEVMSVIRNLADEGRIVIVVMHDLSLAARWADRILLLHRGRLVTDGAPADAITPDTLAAAYGVHARVERCSRGFLHVVADEPTAQDKRMQILKAGSSSRQQRYNGIRVLRVLRSEMLTPRMKRVIVGGEEMEGFGKGPNIKLLFPPKGLAEPEWPLTAPDGRAIWPEESRRPAVRTYSVSHHDQAAGELAIDFVLHGKDGPAANWARDVKRGDLLGVGGPGGRGLRESNWYLFAGDQSALPAIANMLAALPAGTKARAFIEVPGAQEERALASAADVEITWLHRGELEAGRNSLLVDAVRSVSWPSGETAFAWIAGESSSVRALRAYVRDDLKMDRRQFLAIGYWRLGMSETAYKQAFNNDRDEDYFRGAF